MRSVTAYMHENAMIVGDVLPSEQFFTESLNVSRTVMREAFRSMAALKIIDVGNGRRARVGAIDSSVMATSLNHAVNTAQISIAEIWEVRSTIEVKTAARAAAMRTEAEAQEIWTLYKGMVENIDDLEQLIRHDIAFHEAIARASKNALFEQIVRSFEPMIKLVATVAWRTRTTKAQKHKVLRDHQEIATAILKRDTERACQAMEAHFDKALGSALERFSPISANLIRNTKISLPKTVG